jgi:aspartyl-tRNA(Asn)/glutamyl-tRNA(Gln) amidotransferase subunit C
MMKVTAETIEYVAELARLELPADAMEKLITEMGEITGFFDVLNKLDTSGVIPREHVIPVKNVLREDNVRMSSSRDIILENAQSSENSCFKVPRVVE